MPRCPPSQGDNEMVVDDGRRLTVETITTMVPSDETSNSDQPHMRMVTSLCEETGQPRSPPPQGDTRMGVDGNTRVEMGTLTAMVPTVEPTKSDQPQLRMVTSLGGEMGLTTCPPVQGDRGTPVQGVEYGYEEDSEEDDLFWSDTSRYMGWVESTPSLSTLKDGVGEVTLEEDDSVFEDDDWFSTYTLGYLDLTTEGRMEKCGGTGPDSMGPVRDKGMEDDIVEKEDDQLEVGVEDLMMSCLDDSNDSWLYKSMAVESPDSQEDRRVVPEVRLCTPPPLLVLDMEGQKYFDPSGSTVEQIRNVGGNGIERDGQFDGNGGMDGECVGLDDINAVVRMESHQQSDDILSVCQDDRRIVRNRDILTDNNTDTTEPSVGQHVSETINETGKDFEYHHINTALLATNDDQQIPGGEAVSSTPPTMLLTPDASVGASKCGEEDDIPVKISCVEMPGDCQGGGGVETDRNVMTGTATPPVIRLSSRQKISSDDKMIFVSKTKQEERGVRRNTMDDRLMGPCRHDKDGVCNIHGGGAKWRWRPDPRVEIQPDGRRKFVKGKEYFWACDVTPGRNRRVTQTRLSFVSDRKTTIPVNPDRDDTSDKQGDLGLDTSSEGQN